MDIKIIDGSKSWIKTVPNEFAIQCSDEFASVPCERGRILKFKFVKPVSRSLGVGFTEECGIISVPLNTEGIIISKNDYAFMPDVFFRNNDELSYAGPLIKVDPTLIAHKTPIFTEVFYYSERRIEKEKSDENAPEWLKEIARRYQANVAYFKF